MRLPPLNALRAFEAVARTGSVRDAAAEISVTPAAISQQIKVLEHNVGMRLFERSTRRIEPNDVGRHYQEAVGRALRQIESATQKLRPAAQSVKITTLPSLATLWLAPRLSGFSKVYPHVQVSINADPVPVDLRSEQFDLALREARSPDRYSEGVKLWPQELVALASPAYVKHISKRGAVQWAKACLLHEEISEPWMLWLQEKGIAELPPRAQYFSHSMMAMAAAGEAEGIALVPWVLATKAMADGTLVQVDQHRLITHRAYWLLWPRSSQRALSSAATAFRDWLIEQARIGLDSRP
jgi:LysR family transcriptional regulator, glycine cleavage system transcriptional activator